METRRTAVICVLFYLAVGTSSAQSYSQMGAIPSLLFRQEINQAWDASLALSSQMLLTEDFVNGQDFPKKVRNFNIQAIVSYDRSPRLKFDFGFLARKMDPFDEVSAYELRPWQQATAQFYLGKFRLRHRLRLEERIYTREDQATDLDWRLRIRLSLDFPLAGARLDPGEFYVNTSFEAVSLLDQEDVIGNWENRSYFGTGYLFSSGNRLEIGPEIRYARRMEQLNSLITYWRVVWVHAIDLRQNVP
ncbi:MAG TPA: DUF2490 domain-containing protein [Saprospiraceae bacterium]|nr:DUF2490 domain-containing protein [Saprospiraceae bacterium]